MKPRTLLAVAALLVAAAAIWFFALRGKGGGAAGPAATAPAEPGAGPATGGRPGGRPDGPGGLRPGGDPGAVLIDDDPAGSLRLEGLVLTADEQPVAGATVTLSSNPSRTATTDGGGAFAFDGLVARPYTLVARAEAGVGGPLTVKAAAGMVVLRLRPAGTLTVTVVDRKGKPVAGADVALRGLDEQRAATGPDGVARFAPVVPGPYDVAARAAGYAPSFAFRPVGAGEADLTIVLQPGAAVSGRVVDAGGQPVAGARVVYAGASDWGVRPDERRDGVVTGADGGWAFEAIAAGSYRFVARHPAHAPGQSALVSLDGASAKRGVEIALPAGATVRGKVVDGAQRPVASARVRIGDVGRGMIGEPPRQVYSADDGTFVARGLPRRPLSAVAMSESAASATVAVDTSAGDVGDVVLTLDVTGVIAGVVVDRAGEPLEGVQVSAGPDLRGGSFDPAQLRLRGVAQDLTDPDGRFELTGLAEGTYNVTAVRGGGGGMRGRMMFGGDGELARTGTRDLRLVLPADGGVEGKVAYADGSAPAGFSVSVGFLDQAGGKDGHFELGELAPREYRLTVRGDFDDKTVPVKVEEGEVTDVGTITVARGRRIGGRVTFEGQPVAGATVLAGGQILGTGTSNQAQFGMPGGQPPRSTTTGEDGRWSLTGLGPMALAVVAEHEDVGRSPARRVVRGAPDEQQLELVLAPFGALAGTVRDASGDRHLVTVQSTTTPNAAYTVMSGSDGVYRLDKLAPDTYKASAMLGMPMGRGGMQLISKIVTVTSGAEARLDLEIEKGPITVTVLALTADGAGAGSGSGSGSGPGSSAGPPGPRGAAWLLPGAVTARTVEELQLAGAGTGGRTGFNVLLGGRSVFADLLPGAYTACAAVLPREVAGGPMAGQEYFQRHADTLPVTCKALALAAQPTAVTVELAVATPPFDPS